MPELHDIFGYRQSSFIKRDPETQEATVVKYVVNAMGSLQISDEVKLELLEKGVSEKDQERLVPWTISTGARDRDRDRIDVKGWQLKQYNKNPVVLWGHDRKGLPLASAKKTWKILDDNPRLKSVALFPEEGVHPFADATLGLIKAGILRASSVGFAPEKFEVDPSVPEEEHGYWPPIHYQKQHLLEWSVVTVPSNPEALQSAKSHGIDLRPFASEFGKVLDIKEATLPFVPRSQLEAAWRYSLEKAPTKYFEISESSIRTIVREEVEKAVSSVLDASPTRETESDQQPELVLEDIRAAVRDAILS